MSTPPPWVCQLCGQTSTNPDPLCDVCADTVTAGQTNGRSDTDAT